MMFAILLTLGLQEPDSAAIVRELERIEHQLAATYKAGDCDGWSALLAPEWSVIHVSGAVISRVEAIRICREERPAFSELRYDDLSFRVFGDTAVVTGKTTASVAGEQPMTIVLRFTDVFARRGGTWQIVASQATRLAQ